MRVSLLFCLCTVLFCVCTILFCLCTILFVYYFVYVLYYFVYLLFCLCTILFTYMTGTVLYTYMYVLSLSSALFSPAVGSLCGVRGVDGLCLHTCTGTQVEGDGDQFTLLGQGSHEQR